MESYDPVLNPVLNREVRRTGGRVLITLGDQDIDLSPSFVIFLSTRDPTVRTGALGIHICGGALCRGSSDEADCSLTLVAGGVSARPVFPRYLCQLHGHPQQLAEPMFE